MDDPVRSTAKAGHLVIWEESARDGAQAKTLMTGDERVALARATGAMFGEHGPNHVIFGAGFPSIGRQEVEIMRQLADEVDNCTLASHGRPAPADIDLAFGALAGARYARVTFFIAVSELMAGALGLGSPENALAQGLDVLKYALDKGDGVPVDVTLADASRADPGFCADAATALTEVGASVVKVCDSLGFLRPGRARSYFGEVKARVADDVVLGTHQHNDFGLAVANNIDAIESGIRVVATSWLGLGERNGLAPTEQLLFALRYWEPEFADLWLTPPDLTQLVPIARRVSEVTGTPIKVTDAIVGTGVNTISTGTPFIAPSVFRPFDVGLLGIENEVLITQMASAKVIQAVTDERNVQLDRDQTKAAMQWVKQRAYRDGVAVIPKDEFFGYLAQELAVAAEGAE